MSYCDLLVSFDNVINPQTLSTCNITQLTNFLLSGCNVVTGLWRYKTSMLNWKRLVKSVAELDRLLTDHGADGLSSGYSTVSSPLMCQTVSRLRHNRLCLCVSAHLDAKKAGDLSTLFDVGGIVGMCCLCVSVFNACLSHWNFSLTAW